MTVAAPAYREHGNAYNIFILVLTIFSLVLMVYLLLPLDPQTRILATAYDNLICLIVLNAESKAPHSNITTGGDAIWWGIVTLTTVGYGDYYPVTTVGRITAVFVMFSGIGIIGALASILASL